MRATLVIATCLALALSSSAWALTLGEVHVSSALNQQLSAEIHVTGIRPEERDTLRAAIPSEQAFTRAGLRRDSVFEDMKVELIPGPGADQATIRLKSKKRVAEPFLSFLVELRWAGGGVIREYTVLLDPPNLARGPTTDSGRSRSISPGSRDLGDESGLVESVGPSSPGGMRDSGRTYGPVRSQETLWSIAFSLRPDSSITMDQMQLALFQANPDAFDGNMNRIRRGATLLVPSESAIRAINPGAAKQEVRRQGGSARSTSPTRRARATTSRRQRERVVAAAPEPAPEPEIAAPEPEPPATAPEPTPEPAPPAASAVDTEATTAAPVEAPVLAPAETPAAPAPATDAAATPAPTDASAAAGGVDPDTPATGTAAAGTEATPAQGQNLEMPSIWAEGEQPKPAEPTAPVAAPTAPESAGVGGMLSSITSAVGDFKMLLLGLVAALAGIAGYVIYRRRQQGEAEATPPLPTIELENVGVADLEQGLPQAPTAVWQGEGSMAPAAAPAAPEEITSQLDLDALLSAGAGPRVQPPKPAAPPPLAATGKMQAQAIPVRETDYLGEAELHIAYGLYDEAAAVLNRGVKENPGRRDLWMKLLEVYAEAKNAPDYLVAAENFRKQAKPSDADWAKVAQKGKELVPDAPLFSGAAMPAMAPATTTSELDLGQIFDLPAGEAVPAPAAAKPAPSKGEAIEFDLSEFDTPKQAPASAAPPAPSKPAPPAVKGMDFDLGSFDAPLAGKPEAPAAAAASGASTDMTAGLDFKLDQPAAATPAAGKAADTAISMEDFAAADTGGGADDEEAGVKLDLARAYLDMGETDMARGLLQEVANTGSAQQKREAQELLTRA